MSESELLKNVLNLLAGASFNARGAELMQIAEVIHQFKLYVDNQTDGYVTPDKAVNVG